MFEVLAKHLQQDSVARLEPEVIFLQPPKTVIKVDRIVVAAQRECRRVTLKSFNHHRLARHCYSSRTRNDLNATAAPSVSLASRIRKAPEPQTTTGIPRLSDQTLPGWRSANIKLFATLTRSILISRPCILHFAPIYGHPTASTNRRISSALFFQSI